MAVERDSQSPDAACRVGSQPAREDQDRSQINGRPEGYRNHEWHESHECQPRAFFALQGAGGEKGQLRRCLRSFRWEPLATVVHPHFRPVSLDTFNSPARSGRAREVCRLGAQIGTVPRPFTTRGNNCPCLYVWPRGEVNRPERLSKYFACSSSAPVAEWAAASKATHQILWRISALRYPVSLDAWAATTTSQLISTSADSSGRPEPRNRLIEYRETGRGKQGKSGRTGCMTVSTTGPGACDAAAEGRVGLIGNPPPGWEAPLRGGAAGIYRFSPAA